MKKVLIPFLTISLFICPSIKADIPNELAVLMATGAAGLAGYAYKTQNLDLVSGTAVGLGAAAAIALSYWYAAYHTYNALNDAIDYLEMTGRWAKYKPLNWRKTYLINNKITLENFDTVLRETESESVDFPLISMFRKLQQFDALFKDMRAISNKLILDTQEFNTLTLRKTSFFYEKLLAQQKRLDAVIKRVQDNLSMVKQHPHWNEQWKMYQTRDIAFEKTNILVKGVKDILQGAK